MPLVRIDLLQGKTPEYRAHLVLVMARRAMERKGSVVGFLASMFR